MKRKHKYAWVKEGIFYLSSLLCPPSLTWVLECSHRMPVTLCKAQSDFLMLVLPWILDLHTLLIWNGTTNSVCLRERKWTASCSLLVMTPLKYYSVKGFFIFFILMRLLSLSLLDHHFSDLRRVKTMACGHTMFKHKFHSDLWGFVASSPKC